MIKLSYQSVHNALKKGMVGEKEKLLTHNYKVILTLINVTQVDVVLSMHNEELTFNNHDNDSTIWTFFTVGCL